MKVTFFRGSKGHTYDVPVTVGLRPGYCYRLQVTNVPRHPNLSFYPTLVVRGSMMLAFGLRNADFPATLVFRDSDFDTVLDENLVTKVMVLEDPETAIPLASTASDPLQIEVPPGNDPFREGQLRGRPLALFQMGHRELDPRELVEQAVFGTILLPGEKALPLPHVPPCVPWFCCPIHDPILGPRDPNENVAIFDGGDSGLPITIDKTTGKLRGFEPSDAVAEYSDSRGNKRLAVTNRIGMCVPRFIVLRGETGLRRQYALLGPGNTHSASGNQAVQSNQPALQQYQNQHPAGLEGNQRPSSNALEIGTAATGQIAGTTVHVSLRETASVDASHLPPTMEMSDKPLKIIKFPDKCGGLIGDIITFTIRFANVGGQPIRRVVVSDNLAPRFEYVPDSAKSDRPAVFTTQPNDAGSVLLRWEFQDVLQPGQNGTVTFRVRIR